MSIVKGVYEDGKPIEFEESEGGIAIVITIKEPIPCGEITVVFTEEIKDNIPIYIKLGNQQMVTELKQS